MKKIFAFLFTLAAFGAACAQEFGNAVAENHRIEVKQFNFLQANASRLVPKKSHNALITPKGEMKYYKMGAVIRDLTGFMPVIDVANRLYFSEDGQTIYFGSLFPGVFYCDELWVEGKVKGDKVWIDCEKPIIFYDDYDNDDIPGVNFQMGELLLDAAGNPYAIDYLEFEKDGDHIYLDYSEGMRPIVLFVDNGDGTVDIINTTYNIDLRPYTGNTTFSEPSASASISEYVYTYQDVYGQEHASKGRVAIDGKDYYFDNLLPDATFRTHAWIKGTRSGNTITLANDQFLGSDISYYLYYNGFKTNGQREDTGQYKGSKTNITFNVDDKGVITLNSPNSCFPCAFYISGNQFEYPTFRHRIEPFKGDVAAIPADPRDLKIYTKLLEKYGEVSISFLLDNMTADGEYLDYDLLYYCLYLDDDLYTFTKDVYEYIDGPSMTYIPYAYRDAGNYDIYLADDGRNVACLYEDMFNQIGVQAICQIDGKQYGSNIVYIDFNGNITVVPPAGVETITAPAAPAPTNWYDLSGRKANGNRRGIFVTDGKVVIR